MENKTAEQYLESKGWSKSDPVIGGALFLDFSNIMQEYAAQQNKGLVEVLNYALQTIILLSEHKPVRGLDERIAYFQRILKEHGK